MPNTFDLLVSDGLHPPGLKLLEQSGLFRLDVRQKVDPAELERILGNYDGIILHVQTKLREPLIRAASAAKLKYIGCASVGTDHCDIVCAQDCGVHVESAAGANAGSVGDLAMMMILMLLRRYNECQVNLLAGGWDRKGLQGFALEEKTLGLLGTGQTGMATAIRAKAFGMRIVAYDPQFPAGTKSKFVDEYLPTPDEVLKKADVLSCHVPLDESTNGLISEAQLKLLKRGSYVINTSRGGVVNEAAMKAHLDSGHIAGYGVDVFETEPLPKDSWLRQHPKIVSMPHMGGSTEAARTAVAVKIAQLTIEFFRKT